MRLTSIACFRASALCHHGKSGAGDRTRTYDPIITNDVLYQLSYTGPVPRRYSIGAGAGEALFSGFFPRIGAIVLDDLGIGDGCLLRCLGGSFVIV